MNNEATKNNKPQKKEDIGALWERKSAGGNSYLSGNIKINDEKYDIVVFSNSYKKPGEKAPDFRIYLSEKLKDQPQDKGGFLSSTKKTQAENSQREDLDEEIPF
jgi:uncharacterized protein (DUF736 family)